VLITKKPKSPQEVIFANEKNMETLERVIISSMSQSLSLLDNDNYQNPPSRHLQFDSELFNLNTFQADNDHDDYQDSGFVNLEQMNKNKERKHKQDLANNRDRYSDRYTPNLFVPRI
jgi:hypothetical protein